MLPFTCENDGTTDPVKGRNAWPRKTVGALAALLLIAGLEASFLVGAGGHHTHDLSSGQAEPAGRLLGFEQDVDDYDTELDAPMRGLRLVPCSKLLRIHWGVGLNLCKWGNGARCPRECHKLIAGFTRYRPTEFAHYRQGAYFGRRLGFELENDSH